METVIKFGTDGWRGVIADDFTVANVKLATQAVCDWILASDDLPEKTLVVGYDRRAQSEVFAQAVAQVAAGNGLNVLLSHRECSSPVVSYAAFHFGAAAGLMITASHNPPKFNGLKIKANYGGSATPEVVKEIETALQSLLARGGEVKTGAAVVNTTDLETPFLAHCAKLVDLETIQAAGLRIVVDPMYGSGAGYLPRILQEAGVLGVTEIRSERNPFFGGINPEPIAQNMQPLFDAVVSNGADVGLCMDGDADRVGACDSKGRFVDCHRIFAVLLRHLVEHRKQSGLVVRTVSVTRAIDKLCALYNLPMVETPIGFKYIVEKILEGNVLIGGEESGGIGIKGHIPERDGVLMNLMILEAMAASGKRLEVLIDEIFAKVGPHEFHRNDLHVHAEQMPAIYAALKGFAGTEFAGAPLAHIERKDGTRLDFADGSWLLMRPSGTEPVVRVYAESTNQAPAQELVARGVEMLLSASA
jgi:phosphomannomutase